MKVSMFLDKNFELKKGKKETKEEFLDRGNFPLLIIISYIYRRVNDFALLIIHLSISV